MKRLAFVSVLIVFITLLLSQSVFAGCNAWWEIFGSSEIYTFTGKFEIDHSNPPSANEIAERWFTCRTLSGGVYFYATKGYGQCEFQACSAGKTNVLQVQMLSQEYKTRTISGNIKDKGKCFRYKLSGSNEFTYLGSC